MLEFEDFNLVKNSAIYWESIVYVKEKSFKK